MGEARSLRLRILLVAAGAMFPIILVASSLALDEARDAGRLSTTVAWISAAALPALVGIAGVLAIAMVMEGWILRWLVYLERLAKAYARGRYSLRPRMMDRAPAEFRALGDAVSDMAAAVDQRDKALRQAFDEQTMLLREVHHRVKNNLQIVGSLLSLQASRSDDPKVKDALQDALIRLDAMSLAQRFMQEDEERSVVSARQLFESWVAQFRARIGQADRHIDFHVEVEDRSLPMELAAPLLLITTEAVMHAYRVTDDDPFTCRIGLTCGEGDHVILRLDLPLSVQLGADRTISRDLIQGYVRQLRGRLEVQDASRVVVEAPNRLAA
jgi:two-component sensor histidine kinase